MLLLEALLPDQAAPRVPQERARQRDAGTGSVVSFGCMKLNPFGNARASRKVMITSWSVMFVFVAMPYGNVIFLRKSTSGSRYAMKRRTKNERDSLCLVVT